MKKYKHLILICICSLFIFITPFIFPAPNIVYGANLSYDDDHSSYLGQLEYFDSQTAKWIEGFYNGLVANKSNFKKGGKVEIGGHINNLSGFCSSDKLDLVISTAWALFIMENVDVFYVDLNKIAMSYSPGVLGMGSFFSMTHHNIYDNYYTDSFNNESEINVAQQALENVKNTIYSDIHPEATDYDKVKYVHEYLCKNAYYSRNQNPFTGQYPQYCHSIYGALVKGECVCEGYAMAMKYLLEPLGIPCALVQGDAGGPHMWNHVKLYGKWYGVDTTWDDNGASAGLSYFLVGSDFLYGGNRTIKNEKVVGSEPLAAPVISATKYMHPTLSVTYTGTVGETTKEPVIFTPTVTNFNSTKMSLAYSVSYDAGLSWSSWKMFNNSLTISKENQTGIYRFRIQTKETTPKAITYEADIDKTYEVVFEIPKYTIIWKVGDTIVETDENVLYNTTPTYDGETPTKASDENYNYTFDYWSPTISPATKDQTYTAVFKTLRKFTVTWKNGNDVLEIDTGVLEDSTPVFNGTTPTKASDGFYTYEFSGWSPSVSKVTKDTTYTATFKKTEIVYDITFVLNGGSFKISAPENYNATDEVTLPTQNDIKKTGYNFLGWTLTNSDSDKTYITKIAEDETGNKTYYAKWTIKTFIITWVNEDETIDTDIVEYGQTPSYVGDIPTKEDDNGYTYEFKEWGPEIVVAKADKTYYATYTATPKTFSIKYKLHYGDFKNDFVAPKNYTFGTKVELPTIENLSRVGYIFAGWTKTNNEEDIDYKVEISSEDYGDITLHAKWEAIVYKIKYFKNDEAAYGTMATQNIPYNETKPLSRNQYVKDGSVFLGWATETDGEVVYLDQQSVLNLSSEDLDEIFLFAVWKAIYIPIYNPDKYIYNIEIIDKEQNSYDFEKIIENAYNETSGIAIKYGNVTIEFNDIAIYNFYKDEADAFSVKTDAEKVSGNISEIESVVDVYEFSLNGTTNKILGKAKITYSMDEIPEGKQIQLYSVDENGNKQMIRYEIKENQLSFEVSEFFTFVAVYEDAPKSSPLTIILIIAGGAGAVVLLVFLLRRKRYDY